MLPRVIDPRTGEYQNPNAPNTASRSGNPVQTDSGRRSIALDAVS